MNLEVQYVNVKIPQGHTPTWQDNLPEAKEISRGETIRLTAINKREFTIYSLQGGCSIPALTKQIKTVAMSHGGAAYERKGFPGIAGKWRIPIGAFDDFVTFLKSAEHSYALEFDGLKDKYSDNNNEKQVGNSASSEHVPTIGTVQQRYRKSRIFRDLKIEPHYQFNNLRLYTVTYPGPGLIMVSISGRVVVKSHESASRNQYPKIGSIIASCNGYLIP